MSATASTRWYFSDWQSDHAVGACSLAARGLWMELLAIATQNKGRDHGFILVGGRNLSVTDLARIARCDPKDVEPLLAELETNHVFNRDKRGVIYCRRLVRAEKNRRNGGLAVSDKTLKNLKNQNSLDKHPEPNSAISEVDKVEINRRINRDRSSCNKLNNIAKQDSLGESVEPLIPIPDPITESPNGDSYTSHAKPTNPKLVSPKTVLAEIIGVELAEAVVEHRQKIHAPLTAYAAKLLASQFAKATDPCAGARLMLERGWRGFRPDWLDAGGTNRAGNNRGHDSPAGKSNGTMAAFRNFVRKHGDLEDDNDTKQRSDQGDFGDVQLLQFLR